METEQWKPIVGYEWHYQVSNLGKVKSLKFWRIKFLKPWMSKSWYSHINLHLNGTEYSTFAHRLVAKSFIPNPYNLPLVCHKDETLDENWLLYNWEDNLFWWTHSDNVRDKFKKWRANNNFQNNHPIRWKFWKKHNKSKPLNQYTLWLEFIREWDSFMDIERELWINHQNISACCRWKRKSAWWFIWRYI